jgi:Flp pilus assembly protein TadD
MKTPLSLLFIVFCYQAVFFTNWQPAVAESPSPYLSKVGQGDSHSVKLYYQQGNKKFKLKDYTGAVVDYSKAIKIKPKLSGLYYNRGNAKYELGDKQGAIADYNDSIKLNPNDADAYYNRGNTNRAIKNDKAAIFDYNKSIDIDPKLAIAYTNRGNAKSNINDDINAIYDYDKAIALNSNDAISYYNRGNSKLKLGDKQGATSDYEQSLRIDHKFTKARQNLDLIQSDLGYQVLSSLSANSLPLVIVITSITSLGIWRYRKSFVKVNSVALTIVDIVKPATITKGQAAQFGVMTSDIGMLDTLNYSWNFGDNTSLVLDQNPVHVFSSNGYYDVVLTVTDKDGGVTTKTVRVKVNSPL